MGGGIADRFGISSPQQSSDLEKTQAELRQTFTAAEKFRRELEFLQKGGNPLDLQARNVASVSVQSKSLTDQQLEQFVTSEAKGSLAVTASPHGDSVGSSGRLGGPSVCEPNSADNLVLFGGDKKYSLLDHGQKARESGDSVGLELPKKSYKRRIRSRPNRDGGRPNRDVKGPVVATTNHERNVLLSLKGSNAVKNVVSDGGLDMELGGALAVETTLGRVSAPSSVVSDANASQNHIKSQEPLERVEHESLTASRNPPKNFPFSGQTKGLDSESSCTQTGQSLDVNNENELLASSMNVNCNGTMKQIMASNEVHGKEDDNLIKEKANNNSDSWDRGDNEDGFVVKEEDGLKESESAYQNELKSAEGVKADASQNATKGFNGTSVVRGPVDAAEQFACSQNNFNLATKEQEDSILEEARIIQAKRKRIAELSVSTLPPQNRQISHWDFVLEEMSWLANDFAQERIWKVTAAAQISRRVAFASQARHRQQNPSWKLKQVAQTLGGAVMEFWHTVQVKCKELELQCRQTDSRHGLQGYAMRFLGYNSTHAQHNNAIQVPPTPDVISDMGVIDIDGEDNMIEENLVYMVPPGAIEVYRKSIESHFLQSEGTWSSTQEEVGTSGYDAVADNAFEEDDEARSCYLPRAFKVNRLSKPTKKRRKNFKFYAGRSYEMGADENLGAQPSVLSRKKFGGSLNVPIPTKHGQRVPGPFNGGNRTDASSGDTNSFQDGGAQIPNNMEAESAGDFEKELQFDSVEGSDRPRKKKKDKHLDSSFDHDWHPDSDYQNDQKDQLKRRLDAQQLDSNGSNGLYIQRNLKKLKMRQSSDNSYDNLTPMARSIPSPVTSQMSNMSNPKKFVELLRDRGRKPKTLKTPSGPSGSGNPWSLFEDQSLVVLVHDMGPNWELISDAINSTLQFKTVFRSSKECKERHKMLMDRNTGDGADSAEDSGSSQPYPSTLPGIPEGSARQLFQRLQGPMEEDTLKSHFEKIIRIGQRKYYKKQKDNQDPKQLQHPHSSHALALSQVSPNNLSGGPVLTPLELCDAIPPTPDVPPVGYRGAHSGGLPVSDMANGTTMPPGQSSSSSVPGSSSVTLGNDLIREGRYGMARTGSLSKDEQQRMQQYNRMLAARKLQLSGVDRGVHALPARNGIGVMPGMNRNMTIARPGFHGVPSPSTMNSGMAMRNPANMHPRPGPGQGLPQFANGVGSSFPSQAAQPPAQSYPHGPPTNNPHPAFGARIIKERQLQQQRVLQQPSSLQNGTPSMAQNGQKPPLLASHGLGNQILKQQVAHHLVKSGQRNLYSGPPSKLNHAVPADSKQSVTQPHQQKTFSSQMQAVTSSAMPVVSSSNYQQQHLQSQPQPHPKLANLSRATSAKRMVNNRLVNSAEQPTSQTVPMPATSGEHSGPGVNPSMVYRKPSPDSLPSSVGHDVGVQWQQLPSS